MVGFEWVDDLFWLPEEHLVGEGLVVDEDGHGVEDLVLDALAHDGYFSGEFSQDVDDVLAEEDDIAVLLFVVFEFFKQLGGSLIDVGGKGLEQLAGVGSELLDFLYALDVLLELLAESGVEGHALLDEALGHWLSGFELI